MIPFLPSDRRARIGAMVTSITITLIGLATLTAGDPLLLEPTGITCLVCGKRGGVDVLLNVLLFIPLGVGLALAGASVRRAALGGLALSLIVESVQYAVLAGRAPSLSDLLTNTAGTAVGALLTWRWRDWLLPDRAAAIRLAAAAWALWAGTLALGAWGLSRPPVPTDAHLMELPPRSGQYRTHEGRVLATTLGGRATGAVTPSALSTLLADSATASATVHAMLPPGMQRPIVFAFDGRWEAILVLAQRHRDLVFTVGTRATAARLRNASYTLDDAFPSAALVGPGEDPARGPLVQLSATATRTHVVLAAESGGERRVRTVVLSPHLAWTFVAPFGVVYDRWGPFVTLLWVTVLVLPIAYWSRRTAPHGPTRVGAPRTAALLAVILVTMGGASWLAGLAPMPWWEWLGAAAGATLGWALGGRWSASPASCRERSPRRVFAA